MRAPALLPTAALVLLAACGSKKDDTALAATPKTAGAAPAAATAALGPGDADLVKRADLARIRGDTAARVWMIIASDFQCPYCKLWHDSTDGQIRREYLETGKIRVAYINYPLSQHEHAMEAAEAAMCAGAQGKFWQFHDALFASQNRWAGTPTATPTFDSLATAFALDVPAYKHCTSAHVMRPIIQADADRAARAGVQSTPTFLVGRTRLEGAQPIGAFRHVLDSAVGAAKTAPPAKP